MALLIKTGLKPAKSTETCETDGHPLMRGKKFKKFQGSLWRKTEERVLIATNRLACLDMRMPPEGLRPTSQTQANRSNGIDFFKVVTLDPHA